MTEARPLPDVGHSVRLERTITADAVAAFADVTGDRDRIHVDEGFAATSPYGKRIVHGALPEGPGPGDAVEAIRMAEGVGYTDVWTAEVSDYDTMAELAAVATATSSVRLGTGIVSVFSRPAALLAMGASTIQHLSKGRFVLG